LEEAQQAYHDAERRYQAKPRAALAQRVEEAKFALGRANAEWLRARSAWLALSEARSRWLQDANTQYAGCTCRKCSGKAPFDPRPESCVGRKAEIAARAAEEEAEREARRGWHQG